MLHGRTNSLHDMKAIVKTWRNRLPVISDDLSHWSDIFAWRQHHYQFIANHYNAEQQDQSSNHSMLGVHASAQVKNKGFLLLLFFSICFVFICGSKTQTDQSYFCCEV